MDNVTLIVEDMVLGPQFHYEGPTNVALAIGRPVNSIGGQQHTDAHRISGIGQPDIRRFSEIGPTVG